MEVEYREVGGKEFTISPQVWYDAYMMSLPEFVRYYSVDQEIDLNIPTAGTQLRSLFYELIDRMTQGQRIDKSLKKSKLTDLLQSRGLTYDNYIKGDFSSSQQDIQIKKGFKTPLSSEKTIEEKTIPSEKISQGSRLDQVKDCLDQGITSTTQIAKIIGANPSYVQRLKKQLK